MWAPSRRTDSNYFHAAELPAKGLLGSELGYRTGDTDAFSFPLGVGGSGERFAALPWYLCSAAARASAFDLPPPLFTEWALALSACTVSRAVASAACASRTMAIAAAALACASATIGDFVASPSSDPSLVLSR